jgi:hypothetical protein
MSWYFLKHLFILHSLTKLQYLQYLCFVWEFVQRAGSYMECRQCHESSQYARHSGQCGRQIGAGAFSKAVVDRNVSSFCYISGVGISCRQFFPGEEIWFSYLIFNATFAIAVVGININNCSYRYLPLTYRIIIWVTNFMYLYFGLKGNDAVCHREMKGEGGCKIGGRVCRYMRYHKCQYIKVHLSAHAMEALFLLSVLFISTYDIIISSI